MYLKVRESQNRTVELSLDTINYVQNILLIAADGSVMAEKTF